jgi:hypothetical protein
MAEARPEFMDSPYFVDEPGNWHLKTDAPDKLKKEFENYMQAMKGENEPGAINGIHIDYPYEK